MKIVLDNPFDSASIEGTSLLKLNFSKLRLKGEDIIPVAVQNAVTKEVILIAYTNELAFNETLKLRKAVFWSLSRNKLWYKGEESGNTFTVQSIFVNCEQNSLLYKVIPDNPDKGGICHTYIDGIANNCFYRELDLKTRELTLNGTH